MVTTRRSAQSREVRTPHDGKGVDYDAGWKLWSDMVRFYPAGVHRRRLVARWARPLAPRTVLDVGCGPGHLLEVLRRELPRARFAGVDNSRQTVLENRRRLPWCRFERLDLGRATLKERFDLVVCSEVLEHVREGEAALDHLVAMTGGHLLLTVPAGPIFPLEAGFGHLRHYRLEELCSGLTGRGLVVERSQRWGFPFMTIFKRVSNLRPQAVLDGFGAGEWSLSKKAVGAALTALFFLNLPRWGPQLLVLARRR